MNRIDLEKEYWNRNAQDPDVDIKYISDVDTSLCLKDLGQLTGKVLEIGCGVGRLLQENYVGVDTSKEMVKIATQRTGNNVVLNDGRTLPFENESFDSVYSYLVFQHLPKDAVAKYIQEAYRVLKPKGRFVFQCILGDEDEPFSKHLELNFLKSNLSIFSKHSAKQSFAHEQWIILEATK